MSNERLVAVVVALEGAFRIDADILCLLRREDGELGADLFEVEAGHFFVKVLGEDVDAWGVFLHVFPEVYLSKHLIGKAVGHHEAGVATSTSEIDQTAFGQEVDLAAIGKGVAIYALLHGFAEHTFDGV